MALQMEITHRGNVYSEAYHIIDNVRLSIVRRVLRVNIKIYENLASREEDITNFIKEETLTICNPRTNSDFDTLVSDGQNIRENLYNKIKTLDGYQGAVDV
jgi:hypothetical protein